MLGRKTRRRYDETRAVLCPTGLRILDELEELIRNKPAEFPWNHRFDPPRRQAGTDCYEALNGKSVRLYVVYSIDNSSGEVIFEALLTRECT